VAARDCVGVAEHRPGVYLRIPGTMIRRFHRIRLLTARIGKCTFNATDRGQRLKRTHESIRVCRNPGAVTCNVKWTRDFPADGLTGWWTPHTIDSVRPSREDFENAISPRSEKAESDRAR